MCVCVCECVCECVSVCVCVYCVTECVRECVSVCVGEVTDKGQGNIKDASSTTPSLTLHDLHSRETGTEVIQSHVLPLFSKTVEENDHRLLGDVIP